MDCTMFPSWIVVKNYKQHKFTLLLSVCWNYDRQTVKHEHAQSTSLSSLSGCLNLCCPLQRQCAKYNLTLSNVGAFCIQHFVFPYGGFWLKVVCLFQGPPGPPGAQGNSGPPGDGFPGPKVGQVFSYKQQHAVSDLLKKNVIFVCLITFTAGAKQNRLIRRNHNNNLCLWFFQSVVHLFRNLHYCLKHPILTI